MMVLFSVMLLLILFIRPYREHLRNFVHLANEGFLGFFAGGILYYLGMVRKKEVTGAKLTCGNVLTIVIIVHICLLYVWSIYRCYIMLR